MKRLAVVLCSMSILAGCSGDVCSRTESLVESLNKKNVACNKTYEVGLSGATCREKLAACDAEDQAKIHKWYDCIEALPDCVVGQEEAFKDKFLACATTHLQGVSETCFNSIAGSDED